MVRVPATFPDRLSDAMDAAGLNAKQLCEKINKGLPEPIISGASMSNWLNGHGGLPNGDKLVVLCKALNVTPDYLLCYTDVPNYRVKSAKAMKYAEAYTGLPRQALETLHHNDECPFIAPSETMLLDGFKAIDQNRTATEVARLLAQPNFLRALETIETARQYRRALEKINGDGLDAEEARHTAETDYLYLKYIITSRITACVEAILEQG